MPARNKKLHLLTSLHCIRRIKSSIHFCHFHVQPHSTFPALKNTTEMLKNPPTAGRDSVDVREQAVLSPQTQEKEKSRDACLSCVLFLSFVPKFAHGPLLLFKKTVKGSLCCSFLVTLNNKF